jgi:transcriptional regulator with XRE-family HTH domain
MLPRGEGFPRILATCRFQAGITQTELAKRLGIPTHTVISQYEAGLRRFPIEKLVLLAQATDTEPLLLIRSWLESYAPDIAKILFPIPESGR